MLQLRIHGPGKVSLDEVPMPALGPRDALLRVQACGICGSDLGYINYGGVAGPRPEPTPIGHEFSAIVPRVGSEGKRYRAGARVGVNPLPAGNNGNGGGGAPRWPADPGRRPGPGRGTFPAHRCP